MIRHTSYSLQSVLSRLFLGLCSACHLQAASAAGPSHHIYREGKWAGSCSADDFPASYWTDGRGQSDGTQLLGTTFAQRVIHKHQHPLDCAAAKFLLYRPCHSGIGSYIHIMGQVLSLAIRLNRVLVMQQDDAHPYFDIEACDKGSPQHDCYFVPVSSCSLKDVEATLGFKLDAGLAQSTVPAIKSEQDDTGAAPVVAVNCFAGDYRAIPDMFSDFLNSSVLDPSKHHYWWRAQSVAFLVRPNARTLHEMEHRKAMVYPLMHVEAGTISVHVRRGDKWVEAAVADDAAYYRAAESVLFAGADAHGLKRRIFLSTEDPAAVDYFKTLGTWNTTFAEVPRKPDTTKSTIAYTREIGPANEMLNSLINLDLALECDAWVGTLSSNWCRLVDELRSTVRCKADKPYLDAVQPYPPSNLSWKKLLKR